MIAHAFLSGNEWEIWNMAVKSLFKRGCVNSVGAQSSRPRYMCKVCRRGTIIDKGVCKEIEVEEDALESVNVLLCGRYHQYQWRRAESAPVMRTRCAWKGVRELSAISIRKCTSAFISLTLKRRVHETVQELQCCVSAEYEQKVWRKDNWVN